MTCYFPPSPLRGTVEVKPLTETAKIPTRGTDLAAGFDIHSDSDTFVLHAGDRAIVSTGLSMALPEHLCYMVCSRSGMAFKKGLLVMNAPGIIDADYRGELKILMVNADKTNHVINKGDRIAQMVFIPYVAPKLTVVDALPESKRGVGGFGSTGE